MSEELTKFLKLIDKHWQSHLFEYPLIATMIGYHEYNDQIGGFSEKDYDRRLKDLISFKDRLRDIKSDNFPNNEKLSYDIFERVLTREIESIQYKSYRMTVSKIMNFTAFQFNPSSFTRAPFNSRNDFENYIARFEKFPKLVEENIEIMQKGIQEGQIQPRITLDGVVDSFRYHIVDDPNKNVFFQPFKDIKIEITEVEKLELLTLLAQDEYEIDSEDWQLILENGIPEVFDYLVKNFCKIEAETPVQFEESYYYQNFVKYLGRINRKNLLDKIYTLFLVDSPLLRTVGFNCILNRSLFSYENIQKMLSD
ncbi:MAG: DUF885 family protein, partial [Candidatus Heimdallarchaeota archaeon]